MTYWPPYFFTPSLRPALSRPFRDDPPAFFVAIIKSYFFSSFIFSVQKYLIKIFSKDGKLIAEASQQKKLTKEIVKAEKERKIQINEAKKTQQEKQQQINKSVKKIETKQVKATKKVTKKVLKKKPLTTKKKLGRSY